MEKLLSDADAQWLADLAANLDDCARLDDTPGDAAARHIRIEDNLAQHFADRLRQIAAKLDDSLTRNSS